MKEYYKKLLFKRKKKRKKSRCPGLERDGHQQESKGRDFGGCPFDRDVSAQKMRCLCLLAAGAEAPIMSIPKSSPKAMSFAADCFLDVARPIT